MYLFMAALGLHCCTQAFYLFFLNFSLLINVVHDGSLKFVG